MLSAMSELSLDGTRINYFSVKILKLGEIRIGVSTENFVLDTLVGQDSESWGILENGSFSHDSDVKAMTKPLFKGDVVTLILNRERGSLLLCINRKFKGELICDPYLKNSKVYPAVSLKNSSVIFCHVEVAEELLSSD